MIISLTNNFLRLKRESKPKMYRAASSAAATLDAAFHTDPVVLEKHLTDYRSDEATAARFCQVPGRAGCARTPCWQGAGVRVSPRGAK